MSDNVLCVVIAIFGLALVVPVSIRLARPPRRRRKTDIDALIRRQVLKDSIASVQAALKK